MVIWLSSEGSCRTDICHGWRRCTFFQAFFAKRTQNFGLCSPLSAKFGYFVANQNNFVLYCFGSLLQARERERALAKGAGSKRGASQLASIGVAACLSISLLDGRNDDDDFQ